MDYRGPVAGSPLFPPLALGAGLVLGLVIFGSLYFYQRYRKQFLAKLLAAIFLVLIGLFLAGVFWFWPTPGLASASMAPQSLAGPITVKFNRPVSRRFLEKSISPDTPGMWVFENPLYSTHIYRQVSFYPNESLLPDTEYALQFGSIRSLAGKATAAAELRIKTVAPPEVAKIETPTGNGDAVLVYLTAAADRFSEFEFEFPPTAPIEVTQQPDWPGYRLRFTAPLRSDQEYRLIVRRTNVRWNLDENRILERGDTVEVGRTTFRSTPALAAAIARNYPVAPFPVSPQDGWTGVSLSAPLKISFDRPVDHSSAQTRLQVVPSTIGSFRWEGSTMIFQPDRPWRASTDYRYVLVAGVEPVDGLASDQELRVAFRTQDQTVRLKVPAYLQQHTLSCEAAALRMALAFYDVNVSENELLAKLGVDDTPHQGDVWGNPHEKFVGNVDGKQMVDGYGVYWGPIARVAGEYRPSEAFTGWSIQQLTAELQAGHPVAAWVYVRRGTPTSWKTPSGQEIFAIRDEHAVTVVGFVGPADNPTELIVNDPLVGQTHWSRDLFNRKWASFGQSGVVVR